ncbi:hypothetical protein EDF62_2235 [Leucobacter luti]|uniref:Uncharacterized protein n=1 Tax=Leucobacter luti TaxID=340320 RepID=A0A4R6RZA1_9MICO|nr:hypothetical protein [Leucobacter luti]TDP91616.1 hypothetical protein EDF62_2235 [Leucobacter luti]
MGHRRELHQFLDEIARAGIEYGTFTVLCAATSGHDTAIVLYRWHGSSRVYGRIYTWADLVSIFNDENASALDYASDRIVHDFESPPGSGREIQFEWTQSLGMSSKDVRWCDVANDYTGLRPVVYMVCE